MSHVAVVAVRISDMASLKAACKAVGLEFKEGQTTYRYYGQWLNDFNAADAAYKNGIDPKTYGKNATHAIGIPDNTSSYEIGIVKVDAKGGDDGKCDGVIYNLVYDKWAGGHGLEAVAGKDCSTLTKAYTTEVTKKHLISKGYSYNSTKTLKDGTVELSFNKYSMN